MTAKYNSFMDRFNWRINWLYKKWGEGTPPMVESLEANGERQEAQKTLRDGQLLIIRNDKTYTIQGQLLK